MNKKTIKYVIKIVTALISATAIVLAAAIGIIPSLKKQLLPSTIEDKNSGGVAIGFIGEGSSVDIFKDIAGNIYQTEETTNYNNTYVINEDSRLINPLVQATVYCKDGEYDKARAIYEQEEYLDNKEALINLGYIYGEGISYFGKNLEKAETYYLSADCVEAQRDLFALYLENDMLQEAYDLLLVLLEENDQVTKNYITLCIYDKSWDDFYAEDQSIVINAEEIIYQLYEWEYIDSYYNGYNPPRDTNKSRWIYQGIDYAVGDNYNNPYIVYREQVRLYTHKMDMLKKMYYMDGDILYPLDEM